MINPLTIFFLQVASLVPSLWAQAAEENSRPHQLLVQTEVSRQEEFPLKVKGTLLIEAQPEVVWNILTDYEHLEGVFPGLVRSQIIRKEANEVVVEQEYHGLLFFSKNMIFRNKETRIQRIDFRREGGKSKVAGNWSLEPAAGGSTLLKIEVRVRPRRFLFWLIEDMLRRQVPSGLITIREKSLNKVNKDSTEDPEIIYLEEER